jgi:hypothetical protein
LIYVFRARRGKESVGRQIRTQQILSKNLALEDVPCSRQTIKILKALKQPRRLNVSEITQRIGTNNESTSTRLETLENEGVLRHIELGRAKPYSFKESPRAHKVQASVLRRLVS